MVGNTNAEFVRLLTNARAAVDLFTRSGDLDALSESIDTLAAAMEADEEIDPNNPAQVSCLALLGRLMVTRFEYTLTHEDAAEGVFCLKVAAMLSDETSPEFTERLVLAADCLITAHEWYSAVAGGLLGPVYLEQASQVLAEARRVPGANPAMLRVLGRCGMQFAMAMGPIPARTSPELRKSFLRERLDEVSKAEPQIAATMDEIITGLSLAPDAHLELATALLTRFDHRARPEDAEEAITIAARGLDRGSRQRGAFQVVLGTALAHRGVVDQALALWEEAARDRLAPPMVRLDAFHRYGELAVDVGRWTAAAGMLRACLELLRELGATSVDEQTRMHWVAQSGRIAPLAVAAMIGAGKAEEAVLVAEQVRSVELSEALAARTDLPGLREAAPGLAQRYQQIVDELATPPDWFGRPLDDEHEFGAWREVARKRDLVRQRADVVGRIRATPGFSRFQLPLELDELVAQASEGPLVLINVTGPRTDAVIVRADGVEVVRLPLVTMDTLAARLMDLGLARQTYTEAQRDRDQAAYLRGHAGVADVLAWLWESVAAPVLDVLHMSAPRPRIWWLSSGPLANLPLHAAAAPGQPGMLDLVVSSHIPAVRLLQQARLRPRPRRDPRVLAVSVPDAPNADPLPFATAEVQKLREVFPSTTELSGAGAVRSQVEEQLRSHPWVHFACHGFNALYETWLVLHDHTERRFTSRDVARLDLGEPELAFLSACDTAQGSPLSPDEARHFSAELAFAGFRDVVGTLWSVNDRSAVRLTESFYTHLRDNDSGPADALHHAVLDLRAAYPNMPGLWTPYVHIGP